MIELKIDPEFQAKIPPLTDDEFKQLRENIINDGEVYEPICVWNDTIVDGHNRWKVIQEFPDIPFRIKEMLFDDKWAAFDWMYAKQLGRRNLTDEQRTLLIGKMYEARKNTSSFKGNQYTKSGGIQNGYNQQTRIADQIADELGIGKGTVIRAAQFTKGMEAVSSVSPKAANIILKGNSGAAKKDVQDIRDADKKTVKEFAEAVVSGDFKKKKAETNKFVRPVNKRDGGYNTKAMKEEKKLADAVVAEMYSSEMKPFTIEMLEGDIEMNGRSYIDMLRGTLSDRKNLITAETVDRVKSKIDDIIHEIQKIKEGIENEISERA